MTEAYAMEIGRFAYFWAWPIMNMHNRRMVLGNLPEPGLMGGIATGFAGQPIVHVARLH
jgi:hypothetical protein